MYATVNIPKRTARAPSSGSRQHSREGFNDGERSGGLQRARGFRESVPADYHERARRFALDGCYVLALACRDLDADEAERVAELGQGDVEKGLTLLGLLIFRNQLKPETSAAIRQLKQGEVLTNMFYRN
eukprot:1177470-Prorocentrum_minimum.AAC.2